MTGPAAGRTVVVVGGGAGAALAVIRSLGRAGWRVVLAEHQRRSPAAYSRYVDRRVTYESHASVDGVISAVARAVAESNADLVFPVNEDAMLALTWQTSVLGSVPVAAPPRDALAVTTNKDRTLDLAARVGVPRPRSRLVATANEAVVAAATMGWPVVLKPQASHVVDDLQPIAAYTVRYACDESELRREMQRFEGAVPVLLQEYVRGTGRGVELLMDAGRPVAAFQHRRLREVPPTGGPSSYRESEPLDPVLFEQSVRLLREIEWTGLAMVEFKCGTDGPRLMEINGRAWGSIALAMRSGVDFPHLAASLHVTGTCPPESLAEYEPGVRSRNIELELSWVRAALDGHPLRPCVRHMRRAAAIRVLAGLPFALGEIDVLSRDDIRPAAAVARDIATAALAAIRHEDRDG